MASESCQKGPPFWHKDRLRQNSKIAVEVFFSRENRWMAQFYVCVCVFFLIRPMTNSQCALNATIYHRAKKEGSVLQTAAWSAEKSFPRAILHSRFPIYILVDLLVVYHHNYFDEIALCSQCN